MKIAESNDYFYQVCENAARAFPQYAKHKASAFLVSDKIRKSHNISNHH